jgi:rhodanese-related sulfurtransferase
MRFRLLCLVLCAAALTLAAAEPAKKPFIALISGEYEYQSAETLPVFQRFLEANHPLRCVYLVRTGEKEQNIPGLDALERADLAVIFIRRMTLPEDQLARFKKFVESGKPVLGIRTASHAFENWKEWDHDVLGGNYHNHFGNALLPAIKVIPEAASHPVLKGVAHQFDAGGSLYKNSPLPAGSTPLLMGTIPGQPAEPVAWTHTYKASRTFYTSLGHPKDFENDAFRQLLVNAIYWCLDKPAPGAASLAETKATAAKRVEVGEFEKLWREKKGVVLDVRTAKEFTDGHIPGAVNLDVNSADFAKRVGELDKSKTYLVHCAAGVRSARACGKMSELGFTSLIDLAPGFKGWEKAGKPVEK